MKRKCTRRKFIKATSLGATGVALGGVLQSPGRAWGYVARDPINPLISNLRVVYAHDTAMTSGVVRNDWPAQNADTNDAVVATDMDKMACALAEKADVAEAWRTIFIKPAAKQWNQVVVAIKVNCIAVVSGTMAQTTRNAVMKKMCEVLVNYVGVAASNIHIFDGIHGNNINLCLWYGLPAGVQLNYTWGGPNTSVPLPPPTGGTTTCVAAIANGTVDILINMGLCKGHDSTYGSLTVSLKNHYGTFNPVHNTNYLVSINKSEAVLGPMDVGTGRIIVPRQQLVFIDALWASQQGPTVRPSVCPNRLFMGTFGPAVDYQVATKFRNGTMGWPINTSVVDRFLSEFGYGPSDLPNNGQMIDALTWTPPQSLDANRHWERYE